MRKIMSFAIYANNMSFAIYANNKDADQPAHPCSLISIFVVRFLDSIISVCSKTKMSRL